MLLEIEKRCLEAYRRKVDGAKKFRAELQQHIAESEVELADICSAMGEQPVHVSLERDSKSFFMDFFSVTLSNSLLVGTLVVALYFQFDWKPGGGLKKKLDTIISQLEDMRKQKNERKNQFVEVLQLIQNISLEFTGDSEDNLYKAVLDGTDLSMRRLEELCKHLHELQDQKV